MCHQNGINNQQRTWNIDCSSHHLHVLPAQPCSQGLDAPAQRQKFVSAQNEILLYIFSFLGFHYSNFASNYIKRVPFNYFRRYKKLGRLYVGEMVYS